MDEFTDDDDDSQIFDDFQDEYPFDIIVGDNNANADSNTDDQPSSLDSNMDAAMNTIDAESSKLLEEFDLESFSKELLSKAGTGDLVTCLNKHWSKYVPTCYSATDNPTKNMIERDAARILFKPFEIFILNSQNSDKVIEELQKLDDPPLLCGHVFKTGEPSYCCRDCGSDPTCVLCSDCFLNSKHRYHKYKMMTSAGGGGYCDCGDVEAWKEHPSCEKHTKKDNNEEQTVEDIIQKLPHDLVQRARQLFDYLLEYVIEMLCGDIKETLPAHLKPEKDTDDYITVLFNDEIHSYDQVVRTLKRCLNIDDKKAFEYATVVDKEGRSSIKHGKKDQCDHVKSQVEHEMGGHASVPPLETKVMHHSVVAHQHFAEEIIAWMQKFTQCSKALKHVLCQNGFASRNDNYSFVEKLMLNDSSLWKSARNVIHQFFIAVYFMDTNWKKEFAILYTKNYQLIWRNYVKNPDDTVSLTDLAVQLFTVISLSKYLITNFNLLQIIMDTLIEQSKCKLNAKGRLHFQRNHPRNNNEFKRAQFILFDLKYCLISVPDAWNDQLRESFLNGFKAFVEFLKTMHGMDTVKRYTDQHIEFEPEWETAFNLLIKLQKSTHSIIDWCASDAYTLREAYDHLLKVLNELSSTDPQHEFKYEIKKYFNKEYRIIEYDITKQEVSIHAPLTRLLAALHTKLNQHSIQFNKFPVIEKEQLTVNALVEPSLRALAMVSQTNVGLWRRNGYSLLSQVYFYSNVKCRMEMFDRDLESLQMGAALMDANEFLVSILSRFRLLEYWTKENPEGKTDDTKLEYLNVLVEEFLQLLIMIIGERYEANISVNDAKEKIKREVVHQLCISPMAHSDIIKNIYPDNEINVNEIETVLREVAVFKNSPNPSTKGTYELKPQYYDEYNPYFYHYTRIEKTKSEEYVLKQKPESKRFLPPIAAPVFTRDYANIRFLLQSDILLKIFNIILKRFVAKSKACSDGQLVKVLHLIGLALHEEKQKAQYENSAEYKFCEKISKQKTTDNLITHLTNAIALIPTGSYKMLASWTLQFLESSSSSSSSSSLKTTSDSDVVMKSEEEESKEQAKEKRKNQSKAKAEQRRLKILAQMSEMQKDFIKKNKDFFDESQSQMEVAGTSGAAIEMDLGFDEKNYICLGPNQTQNQAASSTVKRHRCILCQEDQEISLKQPPMVLCAYVQHSKVLTKDSKRNIENIDKFDPLFMPSTLYWGIHTTTCGHVMHGSCWRKYVDGVKASENRHRGRLYNFNIKRNEFLCPLCETIGNTVLPLLPNFKEFTNQSHKVIDITYDDWLDGLKNTLDHSIQKELNDKDVFIINPFPLSSITKFMAEAVARNFDLLFSYSASTTEPKISEETMNIIDIFACAAFVFGMVAHPNDDDQRMPVATWNNCAYTVQTVEQLLRTEHKPIFSQLPARQADLLSNLIKFSSLYAVGKNMKHVREYCFKILAAILPYNSVFFDAINIIDCDLFHLLVYLCFSMPYLYDNTTLSSAPCGNINEAYIFKLMLQVHCVQILLKKIKYNSFNETVDNNEFIDAYMQDEDDVEEITEQDAKINELFEYVLSISKIQSENFVKPSPKTVTHALKAGLMPFLRCSVLFFNYMTEITPPFVESEQAEMESFNYFCNYLGISKDLSVLLNLNNVFFKESVTKWCSVNANAQTISTTTVVIDYPLKLNELIKLPNDYIDLISSFSKMSSSLTEPDSASILCLTCGETLSNKTYCEEIGASRVGSCTSHAYKCGRTVGIFLRIAECQVLLLHLNVNAENELLVRGSFIPAPYLDDYGETDQGLRRGNPLRLCLTRYKKMHKSWLSHSIPDEVSRSYQNNQSALMNVDWILL